MTIPKKADFTQAAYNFYNLPEDSYASYDELYNDLSTSYPADFEDENIIQNFGSPKCDFYQILTSRSINMFKL